MVISNMNLVRVAPRSLCISLALLLASCAAVPHDSVSPILKKPRDYATSQTLVGNAQADWPHDAWWLEFHNHQLTTLIEEGLKDSPKLAASVARLHAANAYAEQAHAARLPTLDGMAEVVSTKQSYNMGFPAAFRAFLPQGWNNLGETALNFNFDLDLWGKNRAATAAATSETKAAAIDVAQARLMLSTSIATAYADLSRFVAMRDVQALALKGRLEAQNLTEARLKDGIANRGDLEQVNAAVAQVKGQIAFTDEMIGITRNRLSALVGKGPDYGLGIAVESPTLAMPALPANITTDLIARRPDIAAAQARAEAAASRIKMARASFYPAVNITALAGFQGLGLTNVLNGDSSFGNVGPALHLPLFHGGALRGQYHSAQANYDGAVANYNGTVVNAYQDVADAMVSMKALETRCHAAREALEASERAFKIARARYKMGLNNLLYELVAEDTVLQNRLTVVDLDNHAFSMNIALFRALGGGFNNTQLDLKGQNKPLENKPHD